jgi:sigma-B regulation protein RsbU (phosphoserine phosphatase)
MSQSPARHEAKRLYRQLDSLFAALDPGRPQQQLLISFVEQLYGALREDLGLRGALLYSEGPDGFELKARHGRIPEAPRTISPEQTPLRLAFHHGVYLFPSPEAEGSPHQAGLLPSGVSAALAVGRSPRRHVLLFLVDDAWVREELDFTLNTVRAALGSRLRDERVRGSFRAAMEIQQSLLEEPPRFAGYEIACRSVPAEEVGGDFYDFASFGDEILGLAIGDASGHGLPAALLVRDVVTGLRMGLEKNLKITHVFSKLNRVIHRSNLSSRFVSMFYGELESEGTLIYVNAGHPAPLLMRGDRIQSLDSGGTVVGPLPEARYRRGFARLDPGAVLVLTTDGVLERADTAGEALGEPRLIEAVRERLEDGAAGILDHVFDTAERWGGGRPFADDATLMIVKRLGGDPEADRRERSRQND